MKKVFFADIKREQWHDESETLTYILVPKKWWSIKHWKFSIDLGKDIQLFFMRKD